ncbi:RsmB/NOP family class I SAM-dependent RNA methyltransferase [Allorhizobium undicola]|uniref:RsmB/NOP family class I SAM-dependent RNA methyltransferase n=1 Tax=Allorhizobium undicola TaxID=78527 RepID=UPI003D326F5D
MNDTTKHSGQKRKPPHQRHPAKAHKPAPSHADKPGLEARMAAAKMLAAVVDKKVSLDGLLDNDHGNPAYTALSEADRGLVRAIVTTSLRFLPRIDAMLNALLDAPLPAGARSLYHILATAAAQILYLDVPDHSAVDLAVEQANRDPRSRRFAGMVNAVLRRLGREKATLLETTRDIACVPDWFFARLSSVYGESEARRIAEAQMLPAAIDLSVKGDPQPWAELLGGHVLANGSLRLAAFEGAVTTLAGYEEGAWWVQDAAAALPVLMFGDVAGKTAVDLCAAPGGKTAQLVAGGARVTAVEQSANRLRRLKSNLDRLGLEAELVHSDLLAFAPEEGFDLVLLDAPCSSTGTTRRHPDVLFTKGPEDIAKLAQVQEKLLRHALTLVKPGGQLVFSNCSLDPAEGEDMIARVLADTGGFARLPVAPQNWPGLEEAISPQGDFRTTPAMLSVPEPFSSGLDGFYACRLQKN